MTDRHPPDGSDSDLESTSSLFDRVRLGEQAARDRLVERFLPALRRWASGRVPSRVRSLADTEDFVQAAFVSALERLQEFEPRGRGAFFAYLRMSLDNKIRDQLRSAGRRPQIKPLPPEVEHDAPSPLDEAVGRDLVERYRRALLKLPAEHQAAIMLRKELGYSHQEVAEALGRPTANSARMLTQRALIRLSKVMADEEPK
jgi:RNA polymerase sigma-70 factor (ECF subfamily)